MGCSFCATGVGRPRRATSARARWSTRSASSPTTSAAASPTPSPWARASRSRTTTPTLGALRFLNAADDVGIGARHITVSTCGLIPGIRRFAEEPEQFTLAVSLHSAVQATRDRLMPGVRGMALPALREALVDYAEKTGRRPSLEYALIDGVNDIGRASSPRSSASPAACSST